ncbi:hypothetical protein RND81_06G062800 [Saponaria officinalis]|uniref:J domain-containing protein n=1 Tax=Saponaria officinalis TaxID=3572 RepID=A0AAW1K8E3_SAPOF
MDHHPSAATTTNQTQTESERLLSIAEKLLHSRDLTGAREFALLAQESDSLLEDSDQILAIADVLLASEKRVDNNRHNLDWFSILQTDRRSEPDQIKKNYRRLALLLHPEKNRYPLADAAFKLVTDAWAAVSDPSRAAAPPPRVAAAVVNFWTTCPYCYVLYEYPRVYKECCVRCQNCERAFHAVAISSLPPLVPGKEAYYCCWGFFPLGFSAESGGGGGGSKGKKFDTNNVQGVNDQVNDVNANNVTNNTGFPNWMPGLFSGGTPTPPRPGSNMNMNTNTNSMNAGVRGVVDFSNGSAFGNAMPGMSAPGAKKRGRPRKNPLGV